MNKKEAYQEMSAKQRMELEDLITQWAQVRTGNQERGNAESDITQVPNKT